MTDFIASLTPDPKDARDYVFEWDATAVVPRRVDLRDYTGMVEDQKAIGSCTANATVSACEMFLIANGFFTDTEATEPGDLSRLFNYYGSRHMIGGIYADQDLGSYERAALRVARNEGICFEATHPYDPAKWNDKPSDAAYAEALTMRLGAYYRIALTKSYSEGFASLNPIGQYKYALAKGYPVPIGMWVGEKLRTWRPLDTYSYVHPINNRQIGGHEMLGVGYEDDYAIIENSWGTGWGDKGYFYCPLNVLVNDCIDLWVPKGFAGYERVGPDVTMTPTIAIVTAAYNDMLHRPPEHGGLAHHAEMVDNGMTRIELRQAISNSVEFQDGHTTVESLYRDILLREPDAGGLAGWKASGMTISQMIPGFTGSSEFTAKFG